ncbi:protein Shroom [Agrilus planipennis]|uniref:Protein Shroom n=1 Tax=Agrilus planipennis TaxID=224129 RepID=A0A1W4XRQ0_AGRPL|nr:protein Shroom [Agrilus planipennis]
MMPSRSIPNLQADRETKGHSPSIYTYLQNQSGLNFDSVSTTAPTRDDDSPPPAPPVRDSSTLKSVKYGPGHEKYPSWPVPAAADTPQALRMPPGGGSHRSKSWTDHTNYPKEKIVTYTRPYMKRQHTAMQQKLKTVMERCEKIPPESYESRLNKINDHMYLPRVDRDGKPFGDMEYSVPSPPEREFCKPQLTQADLEQYARSYQDPSIENFYNEDSKGPHSHLTQAELEEYSKTYDEPFAPQHQKQPSYAQSEGYHSYVSSSDSTSTPFLDRLRRDSQAVTARAQSAGSWDEVSEQDNGSSKREGRDSVVTTGSSSGSSSETLKWHGSISDVSIASSTCTHATSSINPSTSRQLIAHSARVKTPQKHNSESVLYIGSDTQENWTEREKRINNANKLKLFPVNTYTMKPSEKQQEYNQRLSSLSTPSVADKISELEKQQKYSYLDPNKRHKVPDPTLKAIQKKALLSFYERHHTSSGSTKATNIWRSEPQLAHSQPTLAPVPQPPPRVNLQSPSRRASCASDYASGTNSRRSSLSSPREAKQEQKLITKHQHSNSCGSLSTDLLGPMIVGPAISVDDWVPQQPPERPPKNPNLRSAFPDLFVRRLPSPDLPPPSPPNVNEDEVINNDEPFPPPPPELQHQDTNEWHDDNHSNKIRQAAEPQVQKTTNTSRRLKDFDTETKKIMEGRAKPISRHSFGPYDAHYQRSQNISRPNKENSVDESFSNNGDFPILKRAYERSSVRYPCAQKLTLNGIVATSQKIPSGLTPEQYRIEPLKPHYTTTNDNNKLEELKKSSGSLSSENKGQRASFAENLSRDVPPPLQPRQMRINHSMRVRMPDRRPINARKSPPDLDKLRETTTKPICFQVTQSKASYLASRREKERIVPDSDTGIYKRTMSPNGHALPPDTVNESNKFNTTDNSWLQNRSNKDIKVIKNNSVNLSRRASMNEKTDINGTMLPMQEQEEIKKPLPDVLPVKEKILPPKSLNLTVRQQQFEINSFNKHQNIQRSPPKYESPPSSPSKSPLRNSPLMPLRTTALSPHSPNSDNLQSSNRNSPSRNEQSTPIKRSFQINSSRKSPQFSVDVSDSPIIKSNSSPQQYFVSSSTTCNSTTYNSTYNSDSVIATTVPCNISSEMSKAPPQRHSPPPLRQAVSVNSIRTIKTISPPGRASPMISTSTNTPLHMSPNTSSSSISTSPASPVEKDIEPPKVIEGLQMIQRTEVVLRVNVCTTDAASQTDKEELPPTPLPTRKKLKEEIECEKLSQDLIMQLPHTDRLKHLLVPGPEHKKPTDYVTGLFRPEVTSRPKSVSSHFRNRNSSPPDSSPPSSITSSTTNSSPTYKNNESPLSSCTVPVIEPTSPLSATSTYFTRSEPKAKLLTRYSQDMNQCNVAKDTKDLNQKKTELMSRLDKKLEVLRSEQLVVSEECRINDELGENVESHISRVARPHEAAKFRLHIEEVGKITSLLLGLSGRLARAENALMGMADDHPEKKTLESKRDKLQEQLEEAKKLKECIDKRSINVSNILYKYLNSEEYADYDHFINMKAKLIMDAREIADKIKLGEEQLTALKETLDATD